MPIELFAESLYYVAKRKAARELYKKRGREYVDYLNYTFGLVLAYKDTAGIVRATLKHLVK